MLRRLLHKIVPPENSLPLAITGLMNLIAFSGPKLLQVLGWSLPMHDMTAAVSYTHMTLPTKRIV